MSRNDPRSVILIVDDNPTNLSVLFDVLSEAGFDTLFAEDGVSAIQRAEHTNPDLILLDVLMPEIDGFETCSRLKRNDKTKDIPVIFMTALSDIIDKVKGFELGAVDYITKPFQNVEVLSRIKTHLTLQNLRTELDTKNKELRRINENLESLVKQKSEKLLKQEKAATIGRLLQGMVHNLKNPLNAILGYINITMQIADDVDNKDLRSHCETISDAANKMHQIMDNLLVKSRMDDSAEITFIDINDLIEQEVKLLNANPFFKYKVTKEIKLDRSIARQPIIYSVLSQVFHNLVNNALDAMQVEKERKSKLTIVTGEDEKSTFIDIRDNGCGIAPNQLEMIFDPFYSTKPMKGEAKEDEPVGSGLGLHTSLELIRSIGGDIIASSKLDKGSSFVIVFPTVKKDTAK